MIGSIPKRVNNKESPFELVQSQALAEVATHGSARHKVCDLRQRQDRWSSAESGVLYTATKRASPASLNSLQSSRVVSRTRQHDEGRLAAAARACLGRCAAAASTTAWRRARGFEFIRVVGLGVGLDRERRREHTYWRRLLVCDAAAAHLRGGQSDVPGIECLAKQRPDRQAGTAGACSRSPAARDDAGRPAQRHAFYYGRRPELTASRPGIIKHFIGPIFG